MKELSAWRGEIEGWRGRGSRSRLLPALKVGGTAVVGRGQPVGSRRAVLCPPHLKETRSSQHLKLTSLRHFVTAVTGDQYVTKKLFLFLCVCIHRHA